MHKQTKVSLISLGCPKNLVDSEKILGAVAESGAVVCSSHEDADVIIVNTCGFIEEAKEESIDMILQAAQLKESGGPQRLIVTGCLAERYGQSLKKDMPEIDYVVGIGRFSELSELCASDNGKLKDACSGGGIRKRGSEGSALTGGHGPPYLTSFRSEGAPPSLRLTPDHYAYLRIADGCDNHCSYCVIGKIRGPLRSRPIEDVLRDAENLAADGAKELNIIAQDTTSYGVDLYGAPKLDELIHKLSKIDGAHWIRILYTHPAHFTDELIDEIAENDKVCNYIDLPIQHINDRILEKMRRRVTRAHIENLIEKLRSKVYNLVMRTSLIVGFPGETESQFSELLDFVEQTRFERLGVFVYSQEEDTPAAKYKRQVSEEIKRERLDAVMSLQQRIAFEHNEQMIGRELEALIEAEVESNRLQVASHEQPSDSSLPSRPRSVTCRWVGRTYADAPEVDGEVYLSSVSARDRPQKNPIGTFTKALIIGACQYDLIGDMRT